MFGLFNKQKIKESGGNVGAEKLVTLIILDGFGVHPDKMGNAVLTAKTPFLDTAWTNGKSTLIHASGTHVGLPSEVVGNSEVGHLNMGAGQVVYQSLPRINEALAHHELDNNDAVKDMFKHMKENNSRLHLVGILSAAGVHGHIKHLFSLLELCKTRGVDPYVHVILDGRDTPATDGYWYLTKLKKKMEDLGVGHIASLQGRFYGMDRDSRWERTKLAYDAMVGLSGSTFVDPIKAVQDSYKKGVTDQFLLPTVAVDGRGKPVGKVETGDAILFWNFREDRARQITKSFVLKDWTHFPRRSFPENICFVTMTGYEEGLPAKVIFPPNKVKLSLAQYLADNGINQLHVSETEKHMHVTYFFNGGVEKEHVGEDFFNIPSPRVNTYAETPEMSALIIRDETVNRIKNNAKYNYGFVLVNFANPDMLGHTGDFRATIKANEITDSCTADIARATLSVGGSVMITADHGNCETMIDRTTKEIHRAHTNNPVPFTIIESMDQVEGKEELNPMTGLLCFFECTKCIVIKKVGKYEIENAVSGTETGISSITMRITGEYVYGLLKEEHGTHRLVRISPFNAQGLRQTTFAGVEIIPILEKIDTDIEIPENDIEFKAVRASGPGGQKVNKTSSAVQITHTPTGITVHSSTQRNQLQNRENAMNLLKSKLAKILEEERIEEIDQIKGNYKQASWGNQIRNYVLHPYKLVKDLRTNIESSNPQFILDGNLDEFVEAQLRIQ